MQRLEKLSDVPDYRRVLTLADGEVPLSARRQRHLIALELDAEGERQAALLATAEKCISPDAMDVCSRLRSLGYRIRQAVPASPTLISTLYIQQQEQLAPPPRRLDNTEIEDAFARLVIDADAAGASDVHIVCHRDIERAVVRLRVHGELRDWQDIPATMARRLCSSAYNSIAEDREVSFNSTITQDANIHLRVAGRDYHLRYAHAPNHPHGFHAAIRILRADSQEVASDLAALGFLPGQVRCLQTMLDQPDGAIIIAGTTGSGKSTTIRTLLVQLLCAHQGRLNVLTVEDPPEYRIGGVIQSPVVMTDRDRERGRNGFEKMIRSGMRRDPDVLMIGEIRDLATAVSFVQAVQSGHLCLTTVHARDCFSILSRLEGLGANRSDNPMTRALLCEPGFLHGLIYQRLLPELCPHCAVPQTADRSADLPRGDLAAPGLRRRGAGCEHCWKGIAGRTVCAQIVQPDPAMLQHMQAYEDGPADALWRRRGAEEDAAIAECLQGVSARDVAVYKMRQGRIDPRDVARYFGTGHHGQGPHAEPPAEWRAAAHRTGTDAGRMPASPPAARDRASQVNHV